MKENETSEAHKDSDLDDDSISEVSAHSDKEDSDDVAEELGAEGVELLDKWAGITQRWVDVSEAYGMPITTIKSKGK